LPPFKKSLYPFSPSNKHKTRFIGLQIENLPPVEESKETIFSALIPKSKALDLFAVIAKEL
jgi:hypothetical protein